MHELVKNEKKESRARPPQQTRTGPTALSNSRKSISTEEKQQKRIAARAATAMANVLQRRREPRSLLMWGDRKKAIIKNYPDGSQVIIVPQTLTPEQEHYEFPPRSRFLKKLANSTAERKRLSFLQDHVVPPVDLSSAAETVTPACLSPPSPPHPTLPKAEDTSMKQPDQLELQEWFSKKEVVTTTSLRSLNRNSKSNKDRAVIDWMNDVERSSKTLLLKMHQVKPSPTPSSCNNSNKIQFKSDAGKRWANSITSNTSLIPPDETSRKHYVRRRLLLLPRSTTPRKILLSQNENIDHVTDAASKIQKIWKDYQSTNNHRLVENQIGMAAMATTGQRTPIAGMVQLVQMLHNSLKVQQQRSHDRMEQLESLLKEETHKRQLAEETMKKLESSVYQQQANYEKERAYQTLLCKVSELEQSVKRQGQSRKELEEQLLQANKSSVLARKQSVLSSAAAKRSSIVNMTTKPRKRTDNSPSISSRKSSTVNNSPSATIRTRPLARTTSLVSAGVSTLSIRKSDSKPTAPVISNRRRMTTVVPTTPRK